ncbi:MULTISPECIES: hypothetical protein [Paenibacillus]|uniref:Uncharacterized protein n=1 Tax=Paenibacillus odorifer TaxID=189426 RepID=A0A1R0X5R8_9BACL|nr:MULTISPECIES: hypothetical protein [Paenibacillus]OMC91030.1 hypothetical protein BJP46_10540 [Paenibacillus odorifer]OMC98254.1 hypothetical protein BJP49_07340 [Paenibacillus odorifer]OMD05961.1 hypothetical protein BJP50_11890 [Paenibacillus odorifer]OMD07979.1 hypothetical protein BJP47_09900 [Paenibacillus odorifer]OMD29834.1 hypothetical protein BJP51_21670 [Paenibacillus odorifer]
MTLPVLSTNTIINLPVDGTRPIDQVVIKVVNNGSAGAFCYITGLSNSVSPQAIFVEELFELQYQETLSKTYVMVEDLFQFNFVYSQEQMKIQVFLVDVDGVWTAVDLEVFQVSRITSEIRDNVSVTSTDFAAISFMRRPGFAIPQGLAAEIRPAALDVMSKRPVRYMIVAGGTLDGTFENYPTPTTNIPATDTALLVNYTCTTVTGGKVIMQGTGSGISGAYANLAVNLLNERLSYEFHDEPVTLVVNSLSGGDDLAVTFKMSEQW